MTTAQEWRWVALWSLVLLAATNIPLLVGWAISDVEMRFGGSVYNVEDANSYLATMRQGARGAWHYTNPYTPEDHRPSIVYLHYLLLGKGAALSGLSLEATYNLARLLCGALLLAVIYHWIAYWTPLVAVRRAAFLLIAPSGGLGWLLILLDRGRWLGSLPLDLISPEAYVFLTLYAPPHLALASACLLLGVLWVYQACCRTHWGLALAGGAAFCLLALVGAFYLVVPAAVLGGYWILETIKDRRSNWRALARIAVSGAMPAPLVAYNVWLFTQEPVYRDWSAQNQVRTLPPLHYVAGYAVLGALALFGLLAARRRGRIVPALPLAWLIVVPLLLALPIGVPRRLIIAAQVPLGLLAAQELIYVVALRSVRRRGRPSRAHRPGSLRYTRRGLRRLLITAVLLFALPTPLLLLAGNTLRVLEPEPPIYHPQAELAALDWLAAHSALQDTVLSAYPTGNYLPARAGNRVVLGHRPQTVDVERKQGEVLQFYGNSTTETWRQALLQRYNVAYVWYGPNERALGGQEAGPGYDPAALSYLHAVYDQEGYTIYEVRRQDL